MAGPHPPQFSSSHLLPGSLPSPRWPPDLPMATGTWQAHSNHRTFALAIPSFPGRLPGLLPWFSQVPTLMSSSLWGLPWRPYPCEIPFLLFQALLPPFIFLYQWSNFAFFPLPYSKTVLTSSKSPAMFVEWMNEQGEQAACEMIY